jgi:hypothetical protein
MLREDKLWCAPAAAYLSDGTRGVVMRGMPLSRRRARLAGQKLNRSLPKGVKM